MLEKLEKKDKFSFNIGDKIQNSDENGSEYLNYDVYETYYNDASQAVGKYNSFYESDYLPAYDSYSAAFDNYSDSVLTYKSLVSGMTQPYYDKVLSALQGLVDDFKDNYLFDKSIKNEELTKAIDDAKNEQTAIENSLGTSFKNYESAKLNYENKLSDYNSKSTMIDSLKNTAESALSLITNFDFTNDPMGGPFTAEIYGYPNTSFYLYDEFSIEDLCVAIKNQQDYCAAYIYWYDTDSFSYQIPDMTTEGDKEVEVKVKYDGKEYSFSYTITVTKEPENKYGYVAKIRRLPRTVFDIGEEFSLDGLAVDVFDAEGKLRDDDIFTDKDYLAYASSYDFKIPDTSKAGTYYVKVKFNRYYYWLSANLSFTVVYPIVVKELSEANAYTVTYFGEGSSFNPDLVKDNLVHIKVAASVSKLDIMDFYKLKKSVVLANPAKLIIDEIPDSVVYKLNIPEKPSELVLNCYPPISWTENNQKELMINFFKELADMLKIDLSDSYYNNSKEVEVDINMESFMTQMSRIYPDKYFLYYGPYNKPARMFVYEVVPGVNFVLATAAYSTTSIVYSIQVENGRTLDLSGTIEINTNWSDSGSPESNAEEGLYYYPEFMPVFWLKDNGRIQISDWSKIKITANGMDSLGLYDYRRIFHSNFEYVMNTLNFDADSLSASQLPVINLSELAFGFVDFYGNPIEYVTEYRGMDVPVITTTLAAKIVKRYSELNCLDKISYCEEGSSLSWAWNENPYEEYPCLYIGNEKNPDRPKMDLRLLQWLEKHKIERVSNVCVVDDGTTIDTEHWYYRTDFNNVIFEVDMSPVEGLSSRNGVIEFDVDVPKSFIYGGDSWTDGESYFDADRLIIKRITHKTYFWGDPVGLLDIRALDKAQAVLINMVDTMHIYVLTASKDIMPTGGGDFIEAEWADSQTQEIRANAERLQE